MDTISNAEDTTAGAKRGGVGMTIWVRALATLIGITYAALLIGGTRLLLLGGSPQYAIYGLLGTASAVMLWRGQRLGAVLQAILIAVIFVWALAEAGLKPWALLPRLDLPFALALPLLLPAVRRHLGMKVDNDSNAVAGGLAAAFVALIVVGVAVVQAQPKAKPFTPAQTARNGASDWASWGKDNQGVRFVEADQINVNNVGKLEKIWSYRTGDIPNAPFSFTVTPLKVDDLLYVCTPSDLIIAIDAETGAQRWRVDTKTKKNEHLHGRICRGVSYYQSAKPNEPCPRRIIAATSDLRLLALNAKDGTACPDFGKDGVVATDEGLHPFFPAEVYSTAPGVVVGETIIYGSYVVDAKSTTVPSGVIRAYDVHTGKLKWAWDMGSTRDPRTPLKPGESYTRSTPNAWATFSSDPALGLVFVPTGNPSPDFFGGYRRPFDEKYGTALVALDVETGQPRWSFQAVHHDIWDLDIPAQPIVYDIKTSDGVLPAVIQATKSGDLFVLDRRNGKPIFPVTEQPVPQGKVKEDWTAPTQPYSAINFAKPTLKESDLWGITPIDQMMCRVRFHQLDYRGRYTPPAAHESLGQPASAGIFNWGGGSIDKERNLLIANLNFQPFVTKLIPHDSALPKQETPIHATEYGALPQYGTPYAYFTAPFLGPLAVPCNPPPWGEVVAVDLTTGKTVWRRPFGSSQDSGPLGIPTMLPLNIGVHNVAGGTSTAGDLTFMTGAVDQFIRAYQTSTGREVWKARLPAGGQAIPISFVGKSGKQIVVVAAGGHYNLQTKPGDYIVAYALKDSAGK
ncbi:MAG: membrane-bound PQQ-dependent dehydrogenase, glucose/quinate/shikimate family [Caulobacterales bacterium]